MSQSDSSNACDDDNVVRRFGVLADRSDGFKQWLLDQLQSRKCRRVLDAACGTGGDSLFLLKHGYEVSSSDSAEAMLKQARKAKISHQSPNEAVQNWEIKNANWLTLPEDLKGYGQFDAVLCIGNSLICLLDPSPNFDLYRRCFENFKSMLKPGGVFMVDHRNMDVILDHGSPINKHVYFKEDTINKISSEIVKSPGKQDFVNITFDMIVDGSAPDKGKQNGADTTSGNNKCNIEKATVPLQAIRAGQVATMLAEVFGENCEQALYGDFKSAPVISDTAYFQHVITKKE
ncbi:glycine N-methyltransferase [Strongylocentrotus purpuratus]|uniref:Glycine N-methyltransferase n=1 Tax=Strongylocentrotus purpuratus TaxID=7668 RepID=A0A7M7HEI9_STRPU|nr:glycine N-methyltransferase [Strongylocentrotus purpuratus]|eukprot:XP_011668466.1 PREDICTED: glycine N-methyltransferase isoform X2 [Strongylocentrotus purpuratus]